MTADKQADSASEADKRADVDSYTSLVKRVQLLDVYLTSTYAHLNVPASGSLEQLVLTIPDAQTNAWYDQEDALLHCEVGFQLFQRLPALPSEAESSDSPETTSEGTKPRGPADDDVVFIGAEYHLVYSVPADAKVTEGGAEAFSARNAVYNAWPFFRELVLSTTGRMSIAPIVLQLLRLPLVRSKPDAIVREDHSKRR